MSFFNDRQRNFLLSDLSSGRTHRRDGFTYLEQWDVRRHLIRLVGPGGFSIETTEADLVSHLDGQGRSGTNHVVIWKVKVRLTIHGKKYWAPVVYEAVATGAGQMPDLAKAHDTAIKSAESDALKRAAINLGTQFGLSLYNDGSSADVVKWTLDDPSAGPVGTPDPDEPVAPEPTPTPEPQVEAKTPTPEPDTDDHAVDEVVEALRAVYTLDTAAQKIQRLADLKIDLPDSVLNTTVQTTAGPVSVGRLFDKAASDALRTPVGSDS